MFSRPVSTSWIQVKSVFLSGFAYVHVEAHPLLLRNQKPGTGQFWPGSESSNGDLGQRGFGTDAQLFERYDFRTREEGRLARTKRPPPNNGGGHGELHEVRAFTSHRLLMFPLSHQEWAVGFHRHSQIRLLRKRIRTRSCLLILDQTGSRFGSPFVTE